MSLGEKLFTAFAKGVIIPLANTFIDASQYVGEKTGKSIVDRMTESREKDEKLREEKPGLWAAKKVAKGAIGGITGATLHDD